MNRQEILTVLRDTIDPEGEVYKRISLQYRDLTPESVERSKAHDLAPRVAEVLRRQPEYVRYPAMAIQVYFARTSVEPNWAAEQLVLRAMRDNADNAVNWLADIVERRHATGKLVMPLWQLTIEKPITLTPSANLVPFHELPQSFPKAWLEEPVNYIQGGGILPVTSLGFDKPEAAITVRTDINPLFVNILEFEQEPEEGSNPLDNIRLCLSAIGPYPLLGPIQWFQFDDADLDAVGPRGFGSSRLEILPYSLPSPVALDADAAQKIVPKFLALRGDDGVRTRRSLERLVQAMLRRDPGNKAADLSIALETLLTDQAGEHTWKVSTRAGVLTGWDLRSKLDRRNVIAAAYQMRSSLVHSGAASRTVRVTGRGQQPAAAVCEEAARVCAGCIRAIIERGGIPSWPEFDLSGGACGWPRAAPPSRRKKA